MNDRFLNMLGLCARAGKCLFGETACLNGIRAGNVTLMLIDHSASENTRKKFIDACAYRNVLYLLFDGDIASAAGKPGRKLVAIADRNFANTLIKLQHKEPNITGGYKE